MNIDQFEGGEKLPYELVDIIIDYATLPEPHGTAIADDSIYDAFVIGNTTYVVYDDEIVYDGGRLPYWDYYVSDDFAIVMDDELFTRIDKDGPKPIMKDGRQLWISGARHVLHVCGDVIYTDSDQYIYPPCVIDVVPDVYYIFDQYANDPDGVYTTSRTTLVLYENYLANITRVTQDDNLVIVIETFTCDPDGEKIISHDATYYPDTYGTIIRVARNYTVYQKDGFTYIGDPIVEQA